MAATLIGFTSPGLRAQPPESLPLPPLWDAVYTLRGGGGYKDNVFLSRTQPQGSAFISGGADVMVLRLAPSGPQFDFFASADAAHFLSTTPSHNEYTAFAQGQVSQDFGTQWKGSLAAEYFYQDQFLDTSFLDASNPGSGPAASAAVRGHTVTLRPGARLNLPGQFWLALETPGTRQFYEPPLDDYWSTGAKLTLGRSYGHGSLLSLSCESAWRFYDSDPALTTAGVPIPDSHHRRFQQDALLTWRHYWDEPRHWRTALKLGGRLTAENGGGFADYAQCSASAQVLYRAKPWEVSAEGRFRRYDYETQTVSATDWSKRRRTEWALALHVERALTKHLKLAAEYEHEETLSNDLRETYTVNTVSGSAQWEF